MYIKGYLQPTPWKNSLSANQVNWGVQMGNIKHNRHLHSRVTEEGKHLFSFKEIVMFSILITEREKCINCASVSLNAFLSRWVFPHAHSIDIHVHKTVFFPSSPIRNFACLVEMTLEGPAKWDEEKQDSCFIEVFWVVRTAALAGGAVLSHSYTPLLTSTPFTDGKGQSRENFGGTELCLAHKPLKNSDATNHTQQQCRITQTFWENRWFKAIHAPFQRDIQNVAELSIWTHFWQVYFLLIWREGFPSDCFKCKYYSHKTHQTTCELWPLVKLAIFLRPLSTRCN